MPFFYPSAQKNNSLFFMRSTFLVFVDLYGWKKKFIDEVTPFIIFFNNLVQGTTKQQAALVRWTILRVLDRRKQKRVLVRCGKGNKGLSVRTTHEIYTFPRQGTRSLACPSESAWLNYCPTSLSTSWYQPERDTV